MHGLHPAVVREQVAAEPGQHGEAGADRQDCAVRVGGPGELLAELDGTAVQILAFAKPFLRCKTLLAFAHQPLIGRFELARALRDPMLQRFAALAIAFLRLSPLLQPALRSTLLLAGAHGGAGRHIATLSSPRTSPD